MSAESLGILGLFITTIAGLIAQMIAMKKNEQTAKSLAEQTRAEAVLLAEKAKSEAYLLSEKTKFDIQLLAEQTKSQATLLALKTEQQSQEMKLILLRQEQQLQTQTKEITVAIEDTARVNAKANAEQNDAIASELKVMVAGVGVKADAAYHEANSVNLKIEKVHQDTVAQGAEIAKRTDTLEKLVIDTNDKITAAVPSARPK